MKILHILLVLLASIVAHGFVSRLSPLKKINSVKLFVGVGCLFGLGYVAIQYQIQGLTLDLLSNLLVYAFGCELYIFIFTMTIGSVSANILLRLLDHNLKLDNINILYSSKQMVEHRMERLVTLGLLTESEHELFLSAKGKLLAKMFVQFKLFFRHNL